MSLFRPAAHFWSAILARLGAEAITMPWGRVYALNPSDRQMRRHEIEHLRQIRHDGAVAFVVRYCWWWATRGYWWNPYEVAARVRAREAPMQPGYSEHPELWRLIILRRRP